MSQLTDRLERDLGEIASGAHPSPSAWGSIVARLSDDGPSEVAVELVPAPDRSKRPVWMAVAAAALLITGSIVMLTRGGGDHSISSTNPDATTNTSVAPPLTVADVVPTIPPAAVPFVGTWVSIDSDGSSQTMEIVYSGVDDYEFVIRDDFATACSGAPATMTGSGLLETGERLVIAQPELVCDDGTIPRIGPPPQAELANYTFELDTETGELVEISGVVWRREGSGDEGEAQSSAPTITVPTEADDPNGVSATSGGMWPQSTLDEIRAAQELADAGDPAYTWQLDATLAAGGEPWGAEIFARFVQEELGWEEFSTRAFQGYAGGEGDYGEVVFIRCAPGQTNPLNALYADVPPEIRRCAPTIDEFTYETVGFSATQPDRRGPSGIWVVESWEMLPAGSSEMSSLFGLMYPDFAFSQVEQAAPPSDAEVTDFLQAFLRARVDGAGAEQFVLREPEGSWAEDQPVPLLYGTTVGVPYQRSEIQRVQGPTWPNGLMDYKVRLFAEDETVVEQRFHVVRHNGQLGLVYGYVYDGVRTTENGQSVAVPFSFLDGEVTFGVGSQWSIELDDPTVMGFGDGRDRIVIAVDPLSVETACENGPDAADAEALARSIMANPDFETTGTVPVRIAGVDGLQIDGVVTAQWNTDWALCYPKWTTNAEQFRIRLYLIDYPESDRVLTIAVMAPETDFERVLDQATPTVESLEFHPG